jgi:nicotinamide mononucleotide transporter
VDRLVAFLHEPALQLLGVSVSWAEVFGDVTGVACVLLVARELIWNWPLGLINNACWSLLFWRSKLYADALLQVVFFALGVYGWWLWSRGAQGARPALAVRRTTAREWRWLAAAVVVATAALAAFLATRTDSPAPFWDASVLTLSLAATYGQAHKLLESWWLWIAVDAISVPLYVSRQLYPTAVVYVLFSWLCILGLQGWQRSLAAQAAAVP